MHEPPVVQASGNVLNRNYGIRGTTLIDSSPLRSISALALTLRKDPALVIFYAQ